MVARKCVALLVLAAGAVHGKRSLQQADGLIASLKASDNAISSQIDAAAKSATASVPKGLDVTPAQGFSAMAESMLPADWSNKVELAVKNFKAGSTQGVDPQVNEFAKMMAGILLLDNEGDSNIANQSLGSLVQQLIEFTFNFVKVYVTAPQKVVTELPGDLQAALAHSQPANFAAWFHDKKQVYEDLLGMVYKPDGAQGGLNHPDSVDISSSVINYAPCIISNTPSGFSLFPTALSITPQILQAAPAGVNIQPQGANIQPAFLYVFPSGFNVQPQGVNIAPTLIGVTPGGYTNTPAGGVVGGSLLAASIAQAPTNADANGGAPGASGAGGVGGAEGAGAGR